MNFLGFPNGLPARLGSTSHPSSHFHHLQATSCRAATNRPRRPAPHPAHWPLGGGSSGSRVLLALLAHRPLGLHVALDLSPIDLRLWPLFGHLPDAEVDKAPLPVWPVGFGHFRPFLNGFRAASRVLNSKSSLNSGPQLINFRVQIFGPLP
jgi:hypothetical protein